MENIKLSKSQKEIISNLQANKDILFIDGLYARCFYSDTFKNVNWSTIFKLESLGLIERINMNFRIK